MIESIIIAIRTVLKVTYLASVLLYHSLMLRALFQFILCTINFTVNTMQSMPYPKPISASNCILLVKYTKIYLARSQNCSYILHHFPFR